MSTLLSRKLLPLWILALGWTLLFLLAQTKGPGITDGLLAKAISLDLLVTVPLFYFLAIRNSTIPKTTLIPVILLGLLLGKSILPAENQEILSFFLRRIMPLIELTVLVYLGRRIYSFILSVKSKSSKIDFYETVSWVIKKEFSGAIARLFLLEAGTLYFGLWHWKKVKRKENEFTYHRETGTLAIVYILIAVICIETVAFHFLLQGWSKTVAWIVTAISIYSGFQLLGVAKSLAKRSFVLSDSKLLLRYGILSAADIDYENIAFIEEQSALHTPEENERQLSPLGAIESTNVLLRFRNPVEIYGMGKAVKTKALSIFVDEKSRFISALSEKIRAIRSPD